MKNWRTLIIIGVTIFIFWLIKFQLGFPSADVSIIGVILTVSSILFGFLAGFFISELWTRYTEIRMLMGTRTSEGINMIKYAEYFFRNKKFKKDFKKLVEKATIADEVVEWDEGHLEESYYREIENSFKHIKIKNKKDEIYFNNLLDSYHQFVEATVRLDTLGKERLFPSEWIMIAGLSVVIIFSILFLDTTHFFYRGIILLFPALVVLALSIMNDLDTLMWSKEIVSLEPNEKIFDALGVKRFYLKKKKKFITLAKDYRTEDDLKGELKQVYLNILKRRKETS